MFIGIINNSGLTDFGDTIQSPVSLLVNALVQSQRVQFRDFNQQRYTGIYGKNV